MNRNKLLVTTLAAAVFAAPMAITPTASAHPRDGRYDRDGRYGRDGRYDRDHSRYRGERRHYRHARWKRGQRLGAYHRHYDRVDYRAYRLRAPPRGYHYVRDDRGDIILAAIATGLIISVIAANN